MAFIIDTTLYSYNVIPFGLKNAEATYNKVFAIFFGKRMEIYVDDMINESVEETNHVQDFEETFRILRHYFMKLNPKKCIFGVKFENFLGTSSIKEGLRQIPTRSKLCVT